MYGFFLVVLNLKLLLVAISSKFKKGELVT